MEGSTSTWHQAFRTKNLLHFMGSKKPYVDVMIEYHNCKMSQLPLVKEDVACPGLNVDARIRSRLVHSILCQRPQHPSFDFFPFYVAFSGFTHNRALMERGWGGGGDECTIDLKFVCQMKNHTCFCCKIRTFTLSVINKQK